MNFYEMNIFMNEVDHHPIYSSIRALLKDDTRVSLKKSFENGFHLSVFGWFTHTQISQISAEFASLLIAHPTERYDEAAFRNRYKKVAEIAMKEKALEVIHQNKVLIAKREDLYGFQNKKQLQIYIKINQIFDRWFINCYWNKDNNILSITKDIVPFCAYLPDTVLSREHALYSNGFVSHLSHYLGLLHSLNEKNKQAIVERFEQAAENDRESLMENLDKDNALTRELKVLFQEMKDAVKRDVLDFHSPHDDAHIEKKVAASSNRHKLAMGTPTLSKLILKDSVLITNRWILNVLYEKLVLLNIKPLDKFYMNYLLCSIRFKKEEVHG
ncbi:hypothetical protein AB685_08710 [Bacillus sp. LL01]|uniref:hypothetical protein n=1 Tax=Bacillus sp. LL01 TaxID=1665556 RepID=UPI00064CE8CB|nr:hypothetical protein [Bacillus sp. LL01]KMJ59131.1 hypothetical protein AB685_08710 [Bacillus sp. LL01]